MFTLEEKYSKQEISEPGTGQIAQILKITLVNVKPNQRPQ